MKKTKVGIVEDEMIIADTIGLALRRLNYDHCAPVNSYEHAVQMLASEKPDVVILDINLNAALDGVDLAHFINANHNIPIIYLTANSDLTTIERSKTTLPSAFLVKPFKEADLLSAIEISLYNHKSRDEESHQGVNPFSSKIIEKYELTPREVEILQLISNGLKHKQIAGQLFISESTVKKHLSNVYQKMGVQSNIDALNKLKEG